MAIKPRRDKCKKELKSYGAILLGPPNKRNLTRKYHICNKCYRQLNQFIKK